MNPNLIRALVFKDLRLFLRDRFFALITLLGVAAYALIYLVMPADVDETLELGLFAQPIPPGLPLVTADNPAGAEAAGIAFTPFDSEAALREAVTGGDPVAGLLLPPGFGTPDFDAPPGEPVALTVVFAASVPESLQDAVVALVSGLGLGLGGVPLNVALVPEIIGADLAGAQIPLRDRMLPLFAVLILLIETMSLASLITEEVEARTIRALLVTPVTLGGLFLSKGIVGVGLAFSQAAVLLLVTGGLAHQPLLLLAMLLFGSLMVTGLAFLIASVSRDILSVIAWGMLAIIVLALPALAVMFPGTGSVWMQLIPSYYLVEAVDQAANFGAGWGDLWQNALVLLVAGLMVLLAGAAVLRRRVYAA